VTAKYKADELLLALEKKYPNAAFIREFETLDEVEMARFETETFPFTPGPSIRRIDALMIEGETRTAVEVKTSWADFKNESHEKRRPWIALTNRFVYLAPLGVIPAARIPDGCGLWEYDGKSIAVTLKCRVAKEVPPLPDYMVRNLMWRISNLEKAKRKDRRRVALVQSR
jgi:hypothetical protein